MGRKATVVRTETTTDDEEGKEEALAKHLDVALFSNAGSTEDDTIDKVHVLRIDPDEGYLGSMEATATEFDVYQRFGGSKFMIEAKNERGRIITRRTLKLAGDPVFMSEVFEARWRKANGLKPKKSEDEAAPESGYSAKELMALMETKQAAARADSDAREEKRRLDEATREEKIRRDEREWRAQQEKDRAEREERSRQAEREHQTRMDAQRREDDKRREDRNREDEQRREKDHERQLAATIQAAKESQEKSQQFFTNMMAMAKANEKGGGDDTIEKVTQVLTLVEALKSSGSGEPQDAVTTMLARLPETLQAAGSMVGGAIREAKGLPPVQHEEEGEGQADDGSIRLTGAAAAKVKQLVAHLIQQGHDPEKAFVTIADHIMRGGKPTNAAVDAARAADARAKGKPGKHARARKPRTSTAAEAKARVSVQPSGPVPAKPPGAP